MAETFKTISHLRALTLIVRHWKLLGCSHYERDREIQRVGRGARKKEGEGEKIETFSHGEMT